MGGVNIKLSDRIKQYRKKNNLTQVDLANQLYVSKQAISKWENDRSLPDVSLFPTIAKMLDISVDELMGSERKENLKNKKRTIIISSIVLVIVITLVLSIVLLVNNQDNMKKGLVDQTEFVLQVKLPKIEKYDLIQYYEWTAFNNSIYPEEMYYFVFKDEIIRIDETWMEEVPKEMIKAIPVSSSEYPYICDYFKLVDLTTNEYNKIDYSDSKVHQYILYCLQIQNKRLIAIKFEV